MGEKDLIYQFDDVRVDPSGFRIWKAGAAAQIEPKAFQVLLFLIENRGRLVEKRELLDAVWKETFVTENALTREIAQLRKALGENARAAKYIETVPTKGYRFVADVEVKNGRQTAGGNGRAGEPWGSTVERSTTTPAAAEGRVEGRGLRPRPRTLYIFVVALALLAGGVAAWRYLGRPASATRYVRRTVQLTTSLGLDIYPSLSPDGNALAYSSNHEGNFEIFVKPLAPGGHEIQITSDGQQNFEPAWSPDGQFIAYYSRNRRGIWVVPALGGTPRRLTEFGSKPAWSRDGSTIAFQSESLRDLNNGVVSGALSPSTIWSVPSRGGQPRQITRVGDPPGGHSAPAWSPDGRRIVFFGFDTTLAAIWSVAAEGGDLKQLTTNQQNFFDPVYAPDGQNIYCGGYVSNTTFGLWRIPVSPRTGERAGDPVEVQATGTQPIKNISISADGKKIAYSAQSLTSDIWSVALSPQSGEPAGEAAPLLQDRSQRKTNPAFSPDGKRVAFGVWRAGAEGNVSLIDADGGNLTQLTTSGGSTALPAWLSKDEVTYVSYRQDEGALYELNLKTGVEQKLLQLSPDMDFARLSPDGRRLAYNSRKGGTINVWEVTLAEGRPRQLTFDEELVGWPAWSPDSRWLAVEVKRGDDTHIALLPSDGGELKQLTFDHGQSWPHSWSPDGGKIAFAGFRDGAWNVWWVSVKDGSQKQLTNFNKLNSYVRYPAWSPLGNQIVFEYAEMTGNIWMMELK